MKHERETRMERAGLSGRESSNDGDDDDDGGSHDENRKR